MTAKTPAERKAVERDRRKLLGLKRLEMYVHPDDAPAIRALAERLLKKRMKRA